jgi:hypothetical protein
MYPSRRSRIVIELEPSGRGIAGSLFCDGRGPLRFESWLELLGAVEAAAAALREQPEGAEAARPA